MLEEEKINLLPDMPLYENASIQDVIVSKYSCIMIDSCFYSVPDTYVDKLVRCKVYTSKLLVFYDQQKIAEHEKLHGFNLWKIDILNYSNTLFRKPKALVNSSAFKQMDERLKEIYNTYFEGNEKEFIQLLNSVGKYGLKAVDNAIKYLQETCPTNISVDKTEFLCARKDDSKIIYLADYNDDIVKNSVDMLNEFNDLLND